MDKFKERLVEGTIYGILAAATAYIIVRIIGYNPVSLAIILYFQILTAILLTVRSEIASPLMPLLKRIVIVAEGEEMKLKRLLTGEEYKVRDVEKL
jgi:hypothetical protein